MESKCAIVGLPNVGKSTLFNALTDSAVAAENYPFCTIDPNVGVVPVPDPRLEQLAAIVNPAKITPAHMEFVDVAGLVEGASKGEGLGNQFLAHIRETHAIAQVVRCFDNDSIVHAADGINPPADIETINTELCLADQATIIKALSKAEKNARSGVKNEINLSALFEKVLAQLDQARPARALRLSDDERQQLHGLHLLTAKPALYIANVAEQGAESDQWLAELTELAAGENTHVIPVCALVESEIARLSEHDKADFIEALGLAEPGLHRIIRAVYALLGLHTYFTAGPKEVRAWTIKRGDSAPAAAAAIHTDFSRGFIRAEVTAFDDYIRCGGEQGARNAGKCRAEGKNYIVEDGNVILFRFNV